MDMYGGMMAMGVFMMLIPLAGLALLAVLVALLIRGSTSGERDLDALEIVSRRYARGEIDHEEFERKRSALLARPQ